MKLQSKKCRVCKAEFFYYNTTQKVCSPKCAIQLVKDDEKKKFNAETRKMKRKLNDNDRSYQLKEAQRFCNKYVRLRDKHLPCVSCGTIEAKWDAGHYRSQGNNPALRFHHWNIQKQCYHCNQELSANLIEYRKTLISRIGLKNVEWLEGPHELPKLTLEDIKDIKEYFKEQIKYLEENPFNAWMEGLEDVM